MPECNDIGRENTLPIDKETVERLRASYPELRAIEAEIRLIQGRLGTAAELPDDRANVISAGHLWRNKIHVFLSTEELHEYQSGGAASIGQFYINEKLVALLKRKPASESIS